MDPDAALRRIRELTAYLDKATNAHAITAATSELIDLVNGLDEWLSRGGFLPTDWQHNRKDDS